MLYNAAMKVWELFCFCLFMTGAAFVVFAVLIEAQTGYPARTAFQICGVRNVIADRCHK